MCIAHFLKKEVTGSPSEVCNLERNFFSKICSPGCKIKKKNHPAGGSETGICLVGRKLQMKACVIYLTAIDEICIISCFHSFSSQNIQWIQNLITYLNLQLITWAQGELMFEIALLKYTFMPVFCVSFIKRVCLKLSMPPWRLLMKKLYDSVLWIEINNLRSSWHSFDRPQKDERLSRLWNHPVFLNLEPLGWGPAL